MYLIGQKLKHALFIYFFFCDSDLDIEQGSYSSGGYWIPEKIRGNSDDNLKKKSSNMGKPDKNMGYSGKLRTTAVVRMLYDIASVNIHSVTRHVF